MALSCWKFPKIWACHSNFGRLSKPKFWQGRHASRALPNWMKWYSILSFSFITERRTSKLNVPTTRPYGLREFGQVLSCVAKPKISMNRLLYPEKATWTQRVVSIVYYLFVPLVIDELALRPKCWKGFLVFVGPFPPSTISPTQHIFSQGLLGRRTGFVDLEPCFQLQYGAWNNNNTCQRVTALRNKVRGLYQLSAVILFGGA